MTRRWSSAVPAALILAVLPVATAAARPVQPAPGSPTAPLIGRGTSGVIADRYIVVMKQGADGASTLTARDFAKGRGARVHHEYSGALQGFAATMSTSAVESLRSNRKVAFIETDRVVTATATQSPATWGLDRIDQRTLPLNNAYTHDATGSGVNAYVIDTGIRRTHTNFGGRAVHGFSAISDGRGSTDCNGHGTHVAGTVGSSTYGVAKSVRLYAVRVLNCAGSGFTSGVIAGVNWVANNHVKPAVANMSLGGPASAALDDAVTNAVNRGVTMAVAAGNESQSACNVSPARAATAITVASTTSTDARSWFSNYGACVDVFAPGSAITSTWHTSTTATATVSGTSMASPHVAGVAALYLQGKPTTTTPLTVRNAIVNTATANVVRDAGTGSPNRLLFSLLTSVSTGG